MSLGSVECLKRLKFMILVNLNKGLFVMCIIVYVVNGFWMLSFVLFWFVCSLDNESIG